MRLSPRAVVTSVAACALAVGWMGISDAAATTTNQPAAARHIVVLHDNVDSDAVARDHGRRYGAAVKDVYHHALKGYVATFKGTGAADVARDPRVAFVELDREVHATQTTPDVPWGLDRIDQRALPLNDSFLPPKTGVGVTAYIIDTGIRSMHQDFSGRVASKAVDRFDAIKDGLNGEDCNGHGTHVAGTVGGETYGVAKDVTLVPVRVLDCNGSGSWSGVIAGIDFVTAHHVDGARAVANMSLGGPASSAVDAAVTRSINDGVTYVVAAGNGNNAGVAQDACRFSPARVGNALTVGATDESDKKASWSNFGKCVDLFAPGVGILSAGHDANDDTETMSGTSMAAPHTAGVVALYLQSATNTSPLAVRTALVSNLTAGKLSSIGKGSVNGLLFSNFSM